MKKLSIILLLVPLVSFGQTLQKSFDKDVAVYYGKSFLMKDVLGAPNDNYSKFEITPLTASSSREVTTIYYYSEEKNKEGLIIGFFDRYYSNAGGLGREYAFKNLNITKASSLISKIDSILDSEKKWLNSNLDSNNIYFNFEDITILIYRTEAFQGRIRMFWNGLDAEWENSSFNKTRRRLFNNSKDSIWKLKD